MFIKKFEKPDWNEIIGSIVTASLLYYFDITKGIIEKIVSVFPVVLLVFQNILGVLLSSVLVWIVIHFTRKNLVNPVAEKIQNSTQNKTSENETEQQILDYIKKDDTYKYAILIDGEWGVGKTYFVKNNVIPKIESINIPKTQKKYRTIYISLYGIKSTEDLSNQIYISITDKKNKSFSFSKRAAGIIDAGKLIVSDITHTSFLKQLSLKKIMGTMADLNRYVLIFDDLERCSMPINDILGYINNLVEQNASKTIIVANQKEISSACYSNNLELKYMLCTNDNINFTEKSDDSHKTQYNNFSAVSHEKQSKIDIDEMNRRLAYLFSKDNNYERIKEKLIGQTITYKPTIPTVIDNITNIYIKDDTLKNIVLNNKDEIIHKLEDYDCKNIRSLQFALDKFNRLVIIAKEAFDSKDFIEQTLTETLRTLLFDVLITSIYFKKGQPKYENWEDNKSGYIHFEKDICTRKIYFSFKFTHELIYDGVINKDKISKVLIAYMENKNFDLKVKNDALTQLNTYWEMEDEQVITLVNQVKDNFMSKDSIYTIGMYIRIIGTLYCVKNTGIEVDFIDEIFDKMKADVAQGNGEFRLEETFSGRFYDEDNMFFDDYKEKRNILMRIEVTHNKRDTENELNKFFDYAENWGIKFHNYVTSNKGVYLNQKHFFTIIEIEKCFECIKQSKIKDISDFRGSLYQMYKFNNIYDYYTSDIENISKFIELLKPYKLELLEAPDKKIKAYNIGLLIVDLANILERLQNKTKEIV